MFKKKEKEIKPKADKMPLGEWMSKYWRPSAAFMYITCCLCDFAIFPIMFTVVQFWEQEAANDAFRQWIPITLQGGGLFHVSMCAVLGVSAYGRTQEKLAGQSVAPTGVPSPTIPGASNGGSTVSQQPAPSLPSSTGGFGSSAPSTGFGASGFGSSPSPSSSGATSSFGSSSFETATPAVTTGFGGKPAPVIPPFPEK
jgi:hypothetical protein